METKFNFKSSVCTSIEQSERLLALGLKKETADMVHEPHYVNGLLRGYFKPKILEERVLEYMLTDEEFYDCIPAWSLHRLIEMCPPNMRGYMCENIFDEKYAIDEQFDELIATIGYYIKEGYFNKEYLV